MNLREIETLVDLVHVARVSEVTIRSDGRRITIRKDPTTSPPKKAQIEIVGAGTGAAAPTPTPPAAPIPTGQLITAPMVGVFHTAEHPLRIGSTVEPGQVIGSIESMRLMNDVLAEVSGVVGAIMLEDGMAVEYGQPILRVDPIPNDGGAENGEA